jgi:hypothetical protein
MTSKKYTLWILLFAALVSGLLLSLAKPALASLPEQVVYQTHCQRGGAFCTSSSLAIPPRIELLTGVKQSARTPTTG